MMSSRSIGMLVTFLALAAPSFAANLSKDRIQSTFPITVRRSAAVLDLRGGGISPSLISPALAAKIMTFQVGMQNLVGFVSPETVLKKFDVPINAKSRAIQRTAANGFIALVVGSIVAGTTETATFAAGAMATCLLAGSIRELLSSDERVFLPVSLQLLVAAVDLITTGLTLTNTRYASIAAKCFAIWLGAWGAYGMSAPVDCPNELVTRLFGFAHLGCSAFLGCLAFGGFPIVRSVGFAHLASGLSFVLTMMHLTKGVETTNFPKVPLYAWTVVYSTLIVSAIFG